MSEATSSKSQLISSLFTPELVNASISNTLVSSFISSSNNFTRQLSTVILMSSIDEIKKLITEIFAYLKTNFKVILQFINPINIIKVIWNIIKNICFRKYKHIDMVNSNDNIIFIGDTSQPNYEIITISINNNILENIIDYIRQNSNNSIIKMNNYKSIDIKNRNEILCKKELYYMNFNYLDMDIICNTYFDLKLNLNGNIISYDIKNDDGNYNNINDDINIYNIEKNFNNYKTFIDFFKTDSEIYKFINSYYNYYNTKCGINAKSLNFITIILGDSECKSYNSYEIKSDYKTLTLSRDIQVISKNIIPIRFTLEFEIFWQYCFKFIIDSSKIARSTKIKLCDITIDTVESKYYPKPSVPIDFLNIQHVCEGVNFKQLNKECEYVINTMFIVNNEEKINNLDTPNNVAKNNIIKLKINNYNEEQFNEFIKYISTNKTQSGTKKIKIYDVKMVKIDNIKTLPNPEYTKISNQITELEKLNTIPNNEMNSNSIDSSIKSNENNINDKLLFNLRRKLIDIEKNVSITESNYKIENKMVTEKYKDFNTLYLRKCEKEQLINITKTYKNNRQKMIDLGLPDKLGILLEGLPGTGKTSTIWAIATELQKNIYYIHLDTIKTNEQLTEIFQFVNNEANGGIIVFEDIDVMTNIVLERTENIVNNELTLGHFLNLLQGTLTSDGTCYITTTNKLEYLDKAFTRDGRFDLVIKFQNADHYQCSDIFYNFYGRSLSKELLNKLPENVFTPAKFIFFIAKYIWDTTISDETLITLFLESLHDSKLELYK